MASNIDAPRGFREAARNDGAAFTGGQHKYFVASGFATSIFIGDIMKLNTTGYLSVAAAGDQWRGIVKGFQWIGTDGRVMSGPYWPASTVTKNTQDVIIMLNDDPNLEIEVKLTGAATVLTQAAMGASFNLLAGTGNTATGISGQGLDVASINTTALQFRLNRWVERPDNDPTGAYASVIVSPLLHDYRVNTAI